MIEFRQTTDEQWTNTANRPPVEAVSVSTDAVNLEAICEAFQRFLLAVGFTLPEGAHIGYEYDDELTQKEGETCGNDSCRCGGSRITERGVKCHWMFDKGLWLPDCGADVQPTDFPPSGYCPHCGNEIEVIEVDDERPEAEPLDAIVARLSKRVAELESALTNVRDGSKSHSTIEQNRSTNTTDSEVTGANAQRGEQSSTIGNTPTPEQVVEAMKRTRSCTFNMVETDPLVLAAAVRELAWGFEALRKSGPSEPGAWMRVKDIARAVMEAER